MTNSNLDCMSYSSSGTMSAVYINKVAVRLYCLVGHVKTHKTGGGMGRHYVDRFWHPGSWLFVRPNHERFESFPCLLGTPF